MHARLTVSGVSKSFGRREVLRDINAQIVLGQTLVVTGPNGSGKTTLLRILAGLTRPTCGHVELVRDGVSLEGTARSQVVGFMTAEMKPYSELTCSENIRFFRAMHGMVFDEQETRIILHKTGLSRYANDRVEVLSAGMQQRVKLACAVAHHPLLLLLDEPHINLDEAGREILDRAIAEQQAQGMVVLATNGQAELPYGDEVVRLH